LTNQQEKLKKEKNKLYQSYRIFESTGDSKRLFDLSRDISLTGKEFMKKFYANTQICSQLYNV
jgi:hypothetical protein